MGRSEIPSIPFSLIENIFDNLTFLYWKAHWSLQVTNNTMRNIFACGERLK